MQRHGNNQRIFGQHPPHHIRHPQAGRPCHLLPVAVFQPQHNLAPRITIQQRRTPLHPGRRRLHTSIAVDVTILPACRQRYTAAITNSTTQKSGVAPTWSTQTKVTLHQITAGNAARRIDQRDSCLKLRKHQPMYLSMNNPMTDTATLQRHRARATAEGMFLHATAADELQDRLAMVNKPFTDAAIVTGFPDFWRQLHPEAAIVSDSETLDLIPQSHDLVAHMMGLHWSNDPVGQLIQCRRALRPDGLFIAVSFGGDTLQELRRALGEAEIPSPAACLRASPPCPSCGISAACCNGPDLPCLSLIPPRSALSTATSGT